MKRWIGAVVIIGIVVLSLGVAIWTSPNTGGGRKVTAGRGQVGLVRVEGAIMSGESGGSLLAGAVVGADTIVEQLDTAAEDPTLKAVVLRVNSPGGSAVASWEIEQAIKRVQAAGKPVVVSMGDSAASGGYWISAGADKIVASPGTTTGSIGVIMETQNLTAIYEKIGYKTEVFKSGPYKDIGSASREMSEAERAILQEIVDEIYTDFVQVVAEGRQMDVAAVREIADGRVISGRKALELGLVDELGDMKRAVQLAGELANLPGEPAVRELESFDSLFGGLLGASSSTSAAREALVRLLLGSVEVAPHGVQALDPNLSVVR